SHDIERAQSCYKCARRMSDCKDYQREATVLATRREGPLYRFRSLDRFFAEVSLNDFWILADLGWGAFGDLYAVVENSDALADSHNDLHVVFDEQNENFESIFD